MEAFMSNVNEYLVRVKNIRIGEKKIDQTHDDEFTPDLHKLANTKIVVRKVYPFWYESTNYFFHADWIEVLKKNI